MMYRVEESLSFYERNQTKYRDVEFDPNQKPTPLKSYSMLTNSLLVKRIVLMVMFTASLLGLPLVLPPLAPPPMFLFVVPVAIMAMLIFLAVTPPTNASFD